MQTQLPPMTALRCYEAAARRESYTLAADELFLTPSAVSHQIRALEAFLGNRLFVRVGRKMLLTDAGAAYYEKITPAVERGRVRLGREPGREELQDFLLVQGRATFVTRGETEVQGPPRTGDGGNVEGFPERWQHHPHQPDGQRLPHARRCLPRHQQRLPVPSNPRVLAKRRHTSLERSAAGQRAQSRAGRHAPPEHLQPSVLLGRPGSTDRNHRLPSLGLHGAPNRIRPPSRGTRIACRMSVGALPQRTWAFHRDDPVVVRLEGDGVQVDLRRLADHDAVDETLDPAPQLDAREVEARIATRREVVQRHRLVPDQVPELLIVRRALGGASRSWSRGRSGIRVDRHTSSKVPRRPRRGWTVGPRGPNPTGGGGPPSDARDVPDDLDVREPGADRVVLVCREPESIGFSSCAWPFPSTPPKARSQAMGMRTKVSGSEITISFSKSGRLQ